MVSEQWVHLFLGKLERNGWFLLELCQISSYYWYGAHADQRQSLTHPLLCLSTFCSECQAPIKTLVSIMVQFLLLNSYLMSRTTLCVLVFNGPFLTTNCIDPNQCHCNPHKPIHVASWNRISMFWSAVQRVGKTCLRYALVTTANGQVTAFWPDARTEKLPFDWPRTF